MPTRTARLRMFAAPPAGWLFLLPNATVEDVVMPAPIAEKVAADIREQEEKPWDKVPLNTFSLVPAYWIAGSGTARTGPGPVSGTTSPSREPSSVELSANSSRIVRDR
ncbi:hypothetical protein ACIQFU_33200 [Streptomyces sp. NPDC093065]|uniref:hypothetical protein n=1 Tax=Streptomyces sp. NPDC093065 TaxID=3366021 RepID=UPI0037F564E6